MPAQNPTAALGAARADRRTLDVTSGPLEPRTVDLDTFLHPRSVAVIGASDSAASSWRCSRWPWTPS